MADRTAKDSGQALTICARDNRSSSHDYREGTITVISSDAVPCCPTATRSLTHGGKVASGLLKNGGFLRDFHLRRNGRAVDGCGLENPEPGEVPPVRIPSPSALPAFSPVGAAAG